MCFLRSGALVGLFALFVGTFSSPAGAQAPVPRLTPRLTPRPAPNQPAPNPAQPTKPQPASPKSAPPGGSSSAASAAPSAAPSSLAFRPPVLPSYPGLPAPDGYVLKKKYNVPLLVGGGLTLAVTWGTSIAYGSSQNFENGLGALAVPILGPWMALGQRDFTCDVETTSTNVTEIRESQKEAESCIANQTATAGFLVGLGIGQLMGTSLLTVGLLDRRKSWVRMDLAGVEVGLDPSFSPSLTGLLATGSF